LFFPQSIKKTKNNKITVINNSNNKTLVVNTNSLKINNYNFIDKISAEISVNSNNNISIKIIKNNLSVRDISIPVENITDTRFIKDDPHVNQFHNFGILIDGRFNPIEFASIQFNGIDRISKRE